MKLVLDGEWTIKFDEKGNTIYGSPYDPDNKLVSVGYEDVDTGEHGYLFFHHKQLGPEVAVASHAKLQALLDRATLVIGHNLKADLSWLFECGFKYAGLLYDTMIFEYVACKGQKHQVSLAACAERYQLTAKLDIMKEYFAQGVNTDEIPLEQLEEYGVGDIKTNVELFRVQRQRYKDDPDVKTMWPAIKLSMEALECLIDMERGGVAIDREELARVETEFRLEQQALQIKLKDMARAVIGDTPVNFASSADMSMLVYSMEVKDKTLWAETFNIGTETRGAVKKKKYNKRYSDGEFRKIIREQTTKIPRTDAVHCQACDGRGYTRRFKKDKVKKRTGEVIKGEEHKKTYVCKTCRGAQVTYEPNGKIGGFKVRPIDYDYATSSGFSTDKTTIIDLIEEGSCSENAQIFLKALSRLNALDTYLTSFVGGIKSGVRADGICHPNYNQCVTATGRLSSSGPNFQNFPRGNTFPIRRVFVSRWADIGGTLIDTDFAGLEYITAVMLAKCEPGLKSILEKKDRHQMTAEFMFGVTKADLGAEEWKEYRQDAKKHTFSPLYGGGNATEKLKIYKEAFLAEHTGIARWHKELCTEAINNKQIVTPSGRIFAFPEAKRMSADRVVGKTQIVNYPVQSFATADIAWCVIVYLWRSMKGLRSKLVLQMHDSITVDTHPEEFEIVKDLIIKAFANARPLLTERFNYVTNVPIGFEVSQGPNLMEKKTLYVG